jgi:chemotaxis protein CheX
MRPSVNRVPATNGRHEDWTPLLELAAREVFGVMLGCQLAAPTTAEEAALDITSMVGLAGRLRGVLSLRCDGKSAALMASKMLGVEQDKVGSQISDALGEVSNMVAGNFKNKISGLGEGCMLSVPTVITGTDYCLYSQADSPGLEVRLLFEGMPIIISLQIRD